MTTNYKRIYHKIDLTQYKQILDQISKDIHLTPFTIETIETNKGKLKLLHYNRNIKTTQNRQTTTESPQITNSVTEKKYIPNEEGFKIPNRPKRGLTNSIDKIYN